MTSDRHDMRVLAPPATNGPHQYRWRRVLAVVRQFVYDARRYVVHSAAASPRSMASLRALVMMDTHRVEKGLAVPRPRPWFGRSIVARLLTNTAAYADLGGDTAVCCAAVATLTEYLDRNGEPAPSWFGQVRADLAAVAEKLGPPDPTLGGTRTVSRESILKAARLDSLDFFFARHSVRQFADDPVTWDEIGSAVEAAQTTPSVCNRQSWAVQVYPRGEAADAVLALQNGNTGFGHTASHILVITVDLRTFVYAGERNQGWIDGGMFAMSLIYALHALGIGTCCLNWSVDQHTDRQLRATATISDHENVIMMLAIGRLPEILPVARSLRRPATELLRPGRLRAHGDQTRTVTPPDHQATRQEEPCRSTS